MLQYTLNSLKAHLNQWVEGNGTDADAEFIAAQDEIIGRGENRLIRDLNLANLTTSVTTGDTTPGDPNVAKPDDLVTEYALYLEGGTGDGIPRRALIKRSEPFVQLMNRDASAQGVPAYYCENDQASWLIAPYPDDEYTVTVRGRFLTAALIYSLVDTADPDSDVTWLSSRYPDLLAYACDIEAAGLLKNYARKADAETTYAALLDNVRGDTASMRIPRIDTAPMMDRQPTLPGDPSSTT